MSLFHGNGGIHGELHSSTELLANGLDIPRHFQIILLALPLKPKTANNFTDWVVSSDSERNTNTTVLVAASLAMYLDTKPYLTWLFADNTRD